ncbi:DUF916 domain-containing protein [Vagococcus fluvialis]|uniref:DUF916 domain-containing protein n=1 Tax=Vagococcus fluvialis TaxID=2738 RepID=UPI001A8C352A|nr:DUF916 domain-containing protein [Vagococcus fluvialis]MBO0437452.1 DUF916 domain-containing protein [Vagococcus fluvialis]
MRQNKKIMVFQLFFIIFFLFSLGQRVNAEGMDFSVEAILPENQVDIDKSYFDLKVTPNSQQELSFKVSNLSEKNSKIEVTLNPGWTNQNGVLSYAETDKKVDESMSFPITQLIKENKKVIELKPLEEKIVNFKLEIPKKEFDGVIVGGFVFKKLTTNKSQETQKTEVVLKNDIQLVKGIQLTENSKIIPEALNIKSAKAGIVNYRNAFILNFQNPQPRFIRDIDVKISVRKEKKKDVLISEEKKINSMAPNSNVDLPVVYKEAIKPGKYVMEIELITGGLKEHKNLKFEVLKKDYKEIKKELIETGSYEKSNNNTLTLILIGFVIFILLIVVILWINGRRGKKCK